MAAVAVIQFNEVTTRLKEGDPSMLQVRVRYHFTDTPDLLNTLDYETPVDSAPEDMFARGEWPEGATFTGQE